MASGSGPSGTEERRTHVTVEFRSRRLGMYLEPSDDENRGATLIRFEAVDGGPGEAEACGALRPGFRLTGINDVELGYAQFPSIIAALVHSARPLRATFRDPSVHEFRDRYAFLRTKLHVDAEAAALEAGRGAAERNDRAWLAFLGELGGKRGASAGVARLVRDANGELAFPCEPTVRLQGVSPLHGRMAGISSAAGGGEGLSASARQGSGAARERDEAAAAAADALPPPPFAPLTIYRRGWSTGSVGVPSPPGLAAPLPGELPKPAARARFAETLSRLVLQGGIPAAYRPVVWWELSGGHAKAALHPPGYYASLTAVRPSSEALYAIAKDLDRTFPGHPFFESRAGVEALQRLLAAFATHNADVGYCQSLNFVGGFLLLLLPEEQAFWVLDCLINEILPPDYYHNGLLGECWPRAASPT
jgi:hypothetical protein